MPERFYDPEFTQRVIRLLQLKGGRAPSEVADEIVPVLDLSSLFSRADAELPDSLFPGRDARGVQGQQYSRFYGPTTGAIAGSVVIAQFFNPVGSGRLMVITNVHHTGVSTRTISGRTYDTPLTTLSARGPIPTKPGSRASLLQFRFQTFTFAAVPAAMSGILTQTAVGTHINVLVGQVAALEPGRGFCVHPTVPSPAPDTDPLPENTEQGLTMTHIEVAL